MFSSSRLFRINSLLDANDPVAENLDDSETFSHWLATGSLSSVKQCDRHPLLNKLNMMKILMEKCTKEKWIDSTALDQTRANTNTNDCFPCRKARAVAPGAS